MRVRVTRSRPTKGMPAFGAARQRGSNSGLGAVTNVEGIALCAVKNLQGNAIWSTTGNPGHAAEAREPGRVVDVGIVGADEGLQWPHGPGA
eukprot:363631-Chlamydomonas_euryale.AAC.11